MNWHSGGQRKSKVFVLLLLALIAFFTVLRLACGTLFYVNRTDSAPHGVYIPCIDQRLHAGDYVIVELPLDVPTLHVKKGFPLLKQVHGFAGEAYEITEEALIFKGRSYPIFHKDGLPHQEEGKYLLPEGKLLLLNEPEDSFDSRYLGVVDEKQVKKKVRLWISWEGWWKD